jgi:hypothetical protein
MQARETIDIAPPKMKDEVQDQGLCRSQRTASEDDLGAHGQDNLGETIDSTKESSINTSMTCESGEMPICCSGEEAKEKKFGDTSSATGTHVLLQSALDSKFSCEDDGDFGGL